MIKIITENVVKNYFRNPNDSAYRFFDKIAACFGFLPDDRELFWNKVWFGNYIDESDCGIKTNKAEKLVKNNKSKYNKELFEFVNKNSINMIFCFSRLVYKNLPVKTSFEDKGIELDVQNTGGKRDYISKFIYKPGIRPNNDVELNNQLIVYGLRHPSSRCGFNSAHYSNYLKKLIQP